ncbi:MAG: 30S ribosomal protein S8 [Desulfuromonas sp. SDB]|nr:MAG: 30S ribosomal protein S8 [Desulfuromonas sp. SDB]
MSMTDPIADMLTRIRNAIRANKKTVEVPYSNLKFQLAQIMQAEGYIEGVQQPADQIKKFFTVELKYINDQKPVITNLKRVSRPGLRVYRGYREVPRILDNIGISVLSTPLGLMTDREARKKKVGGEIICKIW